jgi:hypothetical protein
MKANLLCIILITGAGKGRFRANLSPLRSISV